MIKNWVGHLWTSLLWCSISVVSNIACVREIWTSYVEVIVWWIYGGGTQTCINETLATPCLGVIYCNFHLNLWGTTLLSCGRHCCQFCVMTHVSCALSYQIFQLVIPASLCNLMASLYLTYLSMVMGIPLILLFFVLLISRFPLISLELYEWDLSFITSFG